ncbi:unnamed protein product [Rotaria sp. Silwood1]|nr:unnamed protein product [Rotaria sp. Silwood1]
MDETKLTKFSNQLSQAAFSWYVRAGTTVLCLNCHGNRLIAAGQQSFQLLGIEQCDEVEKFIEIHDFRQAQRSGRPPVQPTDIGWNPNDEHCFASASTAGLLNIWDANQFTMISQFKIHNATINRLQFHPTNPKLLLTASQDGYAKLIDFRTFNTNKVVASFRHVSEDGFRDIHINNANPNLFAAALNDQCIVPLWDIRRIESPAMFLTTADRTLCLAWNYNESYWLATGGRDRTIRIWNAQDSNNRQEPLFKVQSFGTVAKLSWRPTCRYHIACSTLSVDPRIHVWDVRRPYLPQASFCHHQNSIGDFSWRPNSDNLVSVGRDERLVHAHISSAIKTDQCIPLFSLNVTSKGHVCAAMPNINNEYIQALYSERQVPTSFTGLKKFFSEEIMSKFLKYNETIHGKSTVCMYSNSSKDDSVELFHQFARRWTFGNGDKSSEALAHICDVNSFVAEQLQRSDLKATWQVIKMIYADYDGLQTYRTNSSRNTQSVTKNYHISDSLNSHKHHHHHHYQQIGGKSKNPDVGQQENEFSGGLNERKTAKSQEQIISPNPQMDMIDDVDTYIVRDVLTDDIIFITPEDVLNSSSSYDMLYDNEPDIYILRDGIPVASNGTPSVINGEGDIIGFPSDRFTRQYSEMMIDINQFEPVDEYDSPDGHMQTSTQSILPEGSDKFFTIDESYCPTMQNHPLIFDDVLRKTIQYYVENNELQVAVHLLLVLYPILGENKVFELFNGAHFKWIGMYIELLQKLRLFVKAKQVTKHCIEKGKIPLNYDPSEFDGTIILTAQSQMLKRLPNTNGPSLITSTGKNLPLTPKDFLCSICRIPCRGIFSFCGVCFHGGHIDHIRTWFNTHHECPYGCGHRCKERDTQNRPSRGISQRFTLKFILLIISNMLMDDYKYLFKVVLIGNASVGKTCLVRRFCQDVFPTGQAATIGVDFLIKTVEVNGEKIKLQIWDTAGQERFRSITQSYYRSANALIIVFDINNLATFSSLPDWVREVKTYANNDVLCTLVGNKCDINQREVPTHVAEQFAEKNDMWYLETSAKNSENVGKLFQTIAEELTMKARESTMGVSNSGHNTFLNGDQQTKPVKSNCC